MASSSLPDRWADAVAGDRDAFEAAIAPFQDDLLAAARREIQTHRKNGDLLKQDLTPEELYGEALLAAYERRRAFDPERFTLRGWMIGLMHRTALTVASDEARYRLRKAFSLDQEVPDGTDDDTVQEQLYEFHQPDDITTFGELVAGTQPGDVEVAPDAEDRARLSDEELDKLDQAIDEGILSGTDRHVLLFHDEYELSISETAQILGASLQDTAAAVNGARASLRQYAGEAGGDANAPLPDDPSDAVDSYTGDPVP
jgi:RNA polymerase sigma factor (sigma-70 family)